MCDEQFETFYVRERDACLRVVAASCQDRLLAEDLVAEAFARAWARWRTLRTHPRPAAWVVRAALNEQVSWWRRRRNDRVKHARLATRLVASGGGGDPADTVVQAVGAPAVQAALATLPLRQRQVIALRIFLDLDTVQSATVLGIAPSTVTVHLGRALDTLRAALTPPSTAVTHPTTDITAPGFRTTTFSENRHE